MKFILRLERELNYDETVDIDIRFKKLPNESDRKALLDAIEVIKTVSDAYIGADAKKAQVEIK